MQKIQIISVVQLIFLSNVCVQKKNPSFSYEVVIVDDGSKDKTSKVQDCILLF